MTGAFIRLETDLVDGDNPIEKLEVIPSESQGLVNLDVVPSGEQADFDAARGIGTNSNAANIQWRNVIYAKLQSTQETVRDLQNHQVAKMAMMDTRVRHIESMTRQLSISPARLLGVVGERTRNEETRRMLFRAGTAAPGKAAVLGMPKTLSTLWDEYVNGSCGGGKPACDFVSKERNLPQNKYKYSRRLVIWRCMERLIGNGATINVAVEQIHCAYGS